MIYRALSDYKECKVIALPDKYGYGFAGWTFQKDSPFMGIFGFYIDVIRQAGIHDLGPKHDLLLGSIYLDILGLRSSTDLECLGV